MWKKDKKYRPPQSQADLMDKTTRTNDFDTQIMGYDFYAAGPPRRGYLVNFHEILRHVNGVDKSGVDLYFIDYDGGRFKTSLYFSPYLLLLCTKDTRNEVEEYLRHHPQLGEVFEAIEWVERQDLKQHNHLIGARQHLLKVSFANTHNMQTFKRATMDLVEQNKRAARHSHVLKAHEHVLDVREYDVPYHVRVFIDLDLRVGKWYKVTQTFGDLTLKELSGSDHVIIDEHEVRYDPDLHSPEDIVDWDVPAMPQVLAWDIEAAKKDLMFPDADSPEDEITMVSYMINDSKGFLITNRSYVSQDIGDFEFNPKPEYPGPFEVFNEPNEKGLLERWFAHIREIKPMVMVTFNGDFFDWPYVAKRARRYDLDISDILGFSEIKGADEYWSSPNCCHLDVFSWVKRDSYLPQGSQGLKQVTWAKLKYRPLELDPEEMTPFAADKPQVLAEYSVSDAVSTYYLYHKFVHPFIFSLCKILPLTPDEVLRKGTGTLCEMLLMVQAYQGNILLPHKYKEQSMKYYDGHLIESETYSGGHVECLHAGVFRNDLEYQFDLSSDQFQALIDELDETLRYTIKAEMGIDLDKQDEHNYHEILRTIEAQLVGLRDRPSRSETPYIYHLDVASMYPNIMTTNRLQPDSMVTQDDCRKCHYYAKDRDCARTLQWQWRVEYWGAEASDKRMLEKMLQESTFKSRKLVDNKWVDVQLSWGELSQEKKDAELRAKIAHFSKQSKKNKTTEDIEKDVIICQRENPFYVDTVQAFKNRRIDYKRQSKQFEGEARAESNPVQRELLLKKHISADSMQLAHKVILNSFYGYVKRKGSRWYSDEMAGVTCYTGAKIIQKAREIVDGIGISLELDTDGIWCMLPTSFPTIFDLKLTSNGKTKIVKVEYPGAILNYMVWKGHTNHQYQTEVGEFEYETSVRNSIFFEVDGPYKAMILPTSKEQGINLKKRYAVFHLNGSLAELKGFELKRRGELEIVKSFQGDLFAKFLEGSTLAESYAAAAAHAKSWLSILTNRGIGYQRDELLKLISEEKSLSKPLEEYGAQKSNAITAVRRIVSMLGESMGKSKSLKARYIIAKYPRAASNTERAFPTLIFQAADESERAHFLRQWAQEPGLNSFELGDLIDWDYYIQRLEDQILKIIVIPAHMQKVGNPLPQVQPPQWALDELKQTVQLKISDVFKKVDKPRVERVVEEVPMDIEDLAGASPSAAGSLSAGSKRKEIDEVQVNLSKLPDPQVDYVEWLQAMKKVWDAQAKQRETRKSLWGNNAGSSLVTTKFSKFMFVPNPLETWTVLQVKPAGSGQVRVFVFDGKGVHSILVNVKRRVFVEFKSEPGDLLVHPKIEWSHSNFTLPNGTRSDHLYEAVMTESVYEREASVLQSPLVKRVYESKLEPVHQFLISVGGVCNMRPECIELFREGQARGFEMEWFTPSPSTRNPMLPRFNFAHLQHYEVHGQKFLVLSKSWDSSVSVVQFCPEGNKNPAALSLEAEFAKPRGGDLETPYYDLPSAIKVNTKVCHNLPQFFAHATKVLADIYSEKPSSCLLVVESQNPLHLFQQVRSTASFVTIELAPSYRAFSPLSIAPELSAQVIKSMLQVQDKYSLGYAFPLSDFSRVPVGNFPCNNLKFVIDVAYARKLRDQRSVLWWSPTASPDPRPERVDQIKPLQRNTPGIYTQICVDFEVKNFELNALLVSNYASSVDGAVDHDGAPFTANAFSRQALLSLYDVIRTWHKQARANSWQAEDLIRQFYGWVASPSSYLYDPKLYYFVENLANGIFMKLINVLERAGLTLIHATRSRIVVGTGKYFSQSAWDVAEVIIDTIQRGSPEDDSSVLFTYLDIYREAEWDFLVWMDAANYGGQSLERSNQLDSMADEPLLVSSWTLKDYLPPLLQDELMNWYSKFLTFVTVSKRALDPSNVRAAEALRETGDGPYFLTGNNCLIGRFKNQLAATVKTLNRKYADSLSDGTTQFDFVVSPALDPTFDKAAHNPVLEFVKCVLVFLSMDKRMEKEFFSLQKTLLSILRVGSFEPRAQFKNPFVQLVVPNVICHGPACTNVVDLDVCRLSRPGSEAWRCAHCSTKFDRVQLEERLIQMLIAQINRYQQQDLVCVKCKAVRADDMAMFCKCSGQYGATFERSSVASTVQLYRQLGEFLDMKYLLGLVGTFA